MWSSNIKKHKTSSYTTQNSTKMSSKLLNELAIILLNERTNKDTVKAIILCHRLLFPPDKFLHAVFQNFIVLAEKIVKDELTFHNRVKECSDVNIYNLEGLDEKNLPGNFGKARLTTEFNKMGLQATKKKKIKHSNPYKRSTTEKLPMVSELNSTTPLFIQTKHLPKSSNLSNSNTSKNLQNTNLADTIKINTNIRAHHKNGKFLWEKNSCNVIKFRGKNGSFPQQKIYQPQIPSSSPKKSPVKVNPPEIPTRKPMSNQNKPTSYENIPNQQPTNTNHDLMSSPTNSNDSKVSTDSQRDSGYISHSLHSITPNSNSFDDSEINSQNSILNRTLSLISKEHQEKMTKLSIHLYNIIKEWALEIAPNDFNPSTQQNPKSASQIQELKNNQILSPKSLSQSPPHRASKHNNLSSISCNQILNNIKHLITSLNYRIGITFDILQEDINNYHQHKQEQAHNNVNSNLNFLNSQNSNNNSLTNIIKSILTTSADHEGNVTQNSEIDPAEILQKHLLAVQLYNMNEINLCDLAMAGTRTLSPFQQRKVDLMNGSCINRDSLTKYIDWCEKLSNIISTEILSLETTAIDRAEYLNILFNTAFKCVKSGDLSSAMAIWSGISISPIIRLKKTWSKINTCKHLVLEHLFNPNKNFQNYRAALRSIATNTHDISQVVLIPSMSLLLKDLLYLTKKAADVGKSGELTSTRVGGAKSSEIWRALSSSSTSGTLSG